MKNDNKITKSDSKPSHDEISTRAYELWQRDGCKPGRDLKYWEQAEKELCPSPETNLLPPCPASTTSTVTGSSKPAAKKPHPRSH